MNMKRHNNKSPPCSTSNPTTQSNEKNHEESQTNQNDNQRPRFLIMETTDKNIPLNLNVFTLREAVDGMASGRPKQCKPMKSGSIFIGVEKKHQSKILLRTTMLMGYIPVKVTPHRTLNSRKFVIKGQHRRRNKKTNSNQKELLLLNGSLCVLAYMLWQSKDKTFQKKFNVRYLKKDIPLN